MPSLDRYIQTHHPATEASFFGEQAAFLHAKDCGEILNLFVLHAAPLTFDVGEDVAGHVAPQQLQFRRQLVLSPTPLKTKLCDIRPNDIIVVAHTHLQWLWLGYMGVNNRKAQADLNATSVAFWLGVMGRDAPRRLVVWDMPRAVARERLGESQPGPQLPEAAEGAQIYR